MEKLVSTRLIVDAWNLKFVVSLIKTILAIVSKVIKNKKLMSLSMNVLI